MLDLAGIESKYLEVVADDLLSPALTEAAREPVTYVHFSCHGSPDGIRLTDGSLINWVELDELAWPKLKGKCLVFSSCEVGRGVKKLFDRHKSFCNAIVAPTREIDWAEGLVAYSTFYLRAMRDTLTEADVTVMNHIVGRGTFVVDFAERGGTTYMLGA